MRALSWGAWARLAPLGLLLGAAGCTLVTNLDTGGYQLEAGAVQDGGCEASVCLDCVAARDCDDGGICCLNVTSSSTAFGCEQGPTCSGGAQLCKTDAECGSSATCVHQRCTVGTITVDMHACGTIPVCTPLSQ